MEVMVSTEALRKYFEILSTICPDAIVHVQKDKMFTRVVDTADVMMADMAIPCVTETEWDFGIDTAKMYATLKNISDASIKVGMDGNKVVIESKRATYKITTLDMRTIKKEPSTPKLDWKATLAFDVTDLVEGFKAVMVSTSKKERQLYTWFKWDTKQFYIATTNTLDPIVVTYTEEEVTINRASEGPCITALSLDYLENIKSFISTFDTCTIGISNDYPMGFLVATEEGYRLAFMIAPRIPPAEEGGCPV
jgi:hypothetical protein